MKILIISEFFPTGKDLKFSGGVETRTFFVAKNLAKTHKLTVITRRTANAKKKEKLFNISVRRVGKSSYSPTSGSIFERIKFIYLAIKLAEELEVDVVEGTNFVSHFIAAKIAKTKKIPLIAWYPDVWLGQWIKNAGFIGIFGEMLERFNLHSGVDAYIAISRQTASKLKRHTKKKIFLIPCGVDTKEFASKVKKFEKPTIVSIARLASYKNLKVLVFAFAKLCLNLNQSRLIIVGRGPKINELKDLAKNLKILKRVNFLSNLSRKEVIEILQKSHIFSLPSLVEGFGIVTLEAAAAGIPYVNSNIDVQNEITNGGEGGFLVDPTSPVAFSDKFQELLTNRGLYLEKKKQARLLAKNYDWQKIARQTEEVYKYALKLKR